MIANKTTKISAEKSVGEIQKMLAESNASSILIEYEQGLPDSISFQLSHGRGVIAFRMPCNWRGTLSAMNRDKSIPLRLQTSEHARRVCWRVIRDWLRAQLTLVESGVSTVHEVMMPWMITEDGTTVSSRIFSDSGFLKLTGPQ